MAFLGMVSCPMAPETARAVKTGGGARLTVGGGGG
jgi:hypothetical protein